MPSLYSATLAADLGLVLPYLSTASVVIPLPATLSSMLHIVVPFSASMNVPTTHTASLTAPIHLVMPCLIDPSTVGRPPVVTLLVTTLYIETDYVGPIVRIVFSDPNTVLDVNPYANRFYIGLPGNPWLLNITASQPTPGTYIVSGTIPFSNINGASLQLEFVTPEFPTVNISMPTPVAAPEPINVNASLTNSLSINVGLSKGGMTAHYAPLIVGSVTHAHLTHSISVSVHLSKGAMTATQNVVVYRAVDYPNETHRVLAGSANASFAIATFNPKAAADQRSYCFDFSSLLAWFGTTQDTIANATITAAGLTVGVTTTTATMAAAFITGGVDFATYVVVCRMTSVSGSITTSEVRLPILEGTD